MINSSDKLISFVTDVINEGNTRSNAVTYACEDPNQVKVVFNRDHRKHYDALLMFCVENGYTVVSTRVGTLATVIDFRGF